jgi:hypothetical protein
MATDITQEGPSGTSAFTPFVAYPNPVHNTLSIYFGAASTVVQKDIQLFDMMGRQLTIPSPVSLNSEYVTLDVGYLQSGHYLVRIRLKDEYKVVKFIKL